MAALYKAEFAANQDAWCKPPDQGGLHQWERRTKMAIWLAFAWDQLQHEADFFRSAFVSTGFLVAKDGSENNLVKVKGIPGYDYTMGEAVEHL